MANTYTQIHIQAVFSVRNRECLIAKEWKDELYKYITGIIKNNNHKPICINGMPDHLHILFGMRPVQTLSDLMQDIKGSSSKWINEKNLVKGKFYWQEGYGAFSYSKSHLPRVIQYIERQEEHHKKKTFTDEYRGFLKRLEIEYDERYIFSPVSYQINHIVPTALPIFCS
jgi:putative transposase